MKTKSALIIGASRGLGRQIAHYSTVLFPDLESISLCARNLEGLSEVKNLMSQAPKPWEKRTVSDLLKIDIFKADMSSEKDVSDLAAKTVGFDTVIYNAGGGPHGEFRNKEFKDHEWAYRVGLLAPAKLLHQWLKRDLELPGRFVVVGSRIAEQNPDPLAASYASAKHGIYGLISSIQPELEGKNSKVFLFSPGYIDTQMLPQNASIRKQGVRISPPEMVAQALLRWVNSEGPWHRTLS